MNLLHHLKSSSILEANFFFIILNFVIVIISVLVCWGLGVIYHNRRIFTRWEPIRSFELLLVVLALLFNTMISTLGWALWTNGYIELGSAGIITSILDCLFMILVMDFGMYVSHRIAHVRILYHFVHKFHHRHETTNPISLFVLHPLEVIGFGLLMIAFLCLYPMSITGLIAYLTLNVIFGTLGHSGVEPYPAIMSRLPLIRLLGSSTFHAEHHDEVKYNFGFYTLIWDRLFGTLHPDYYKHFNQKTNKTQ